MSSIQLPALHIEPVQVPDMIGNYERVLRIKQMPQNAPLQTQALQQQVQSGQLGIQQQHQEMGARQALNSAYQGAMTEDASGKPTFDPDKLQAEPDERPGGIPDAPGDGGDRQVSQDSHDTQSAAADLQTKQNDVLGSAAAAVKAANYDPQLAHSLLDSLPPIAAIEPDPRADR